MAIPMTNYERYKQKNAEIESDYIMAKKIAAVEYAKSTNLYNIGDTITDHIGSLIIEKITYYVSFDNPQCVYHGIRLNKNGTVSKKENSPVYQSNIIA